MTPFVSFYAHRVKVQAHSGPCLETGFQSISVKYLLHFSISQECRNQGIKSSVLLYNLITLHSDIYRLIVLIQHS